MKVLKIFLQAALLCSIITATVIVQSCSNGKDESSKSMGQIQAEEGIPVAVRTIQYKTFDKSLSYFAKLYGIRQTTRGALIGGRISKINCSVGQFVKKDQVVVEFPEDAPSASYDQAKTAFENSQKTYERMKVLLAAGETSQAALDGAEAKYLVDKRNYEAVRQLLFIEAQFDGVITEISVKEGDNVAAKDPLFTIAQTNEMRAKVWASDSEINRIKRGDKVTATVNGKTFYGRVIETSFGIDPKMQAFYAEVEFDNPHNKLKINQTADISILTYENTKAIVLERNLIQNDEKGDFVFIERNGVAKKQYVTYDRESEIYVEVNSGLNVNDRLITKGGEQLTDGTKVKVI